MLKIKYFLFVLSFVFICKSVFSQDTLEFTTAADTFLIEMSAKLLETKNKNYHKKAEALIESFSYKWTAGRFSKNQKQHIYFVESLMKKKRVKAYPYYFEFIKCLDGFITIFQPEESVLDWLKTLEDMMSQRNTKNFLKFLQQTDNLFSNNYLYHTRSTNWHFNKAKFYFKYDSLPYVVFEKLDLVCATKKDSSVIKNTKGIFYPITNTWIGENGKLSWERVGFKEDDVYALLNKYNIDLSETTFTADSVKYFNKYFLKKSIGGSLSEKVLSSPPNSRTSYPRFNSYFKKFEIKDIFKDVNFNGGFAIEGANFIGMGDEDKYATIEFFRNEKRFALIKSRKFLIKTNRIFSSKIQFSIYHDSDSIYHSSCKMKYNNDNKELVLMRERYPSYSSPFNDSYHNLDLYCEIIRWKMGEPNIYFEMIKGVSNESNARFMSINHYSDHDYYKLQGIDPINPIVVIKKYSQYYNTRKVRVNTLADFIKKPKEQAVAMIMRLANKGLVAYNVDKKEAFIKDRLFDFLNAKAGLIDYDAIRLDSKTTFESNAELDIKNFDLKINGVSQIMLSDSQRVYVYPDGNRIVMKENRDFVFSGRVHAGLFDFYAHDCSFEYDTFRLNLPRIDSLSFAVKYKEKDETGRQSYIRVQNVIANLSGDIRIDNPNNKSGKRNFSTYPVFHSPNDSYVYYHYNKIKNGAYDKEKFYYHVSPFEIDSLVDFSTDNLKFEGYLASDEMFPNIEEPLIVMPDYSLGFFHQIPDKGYAVYSNKGKFFNTLILDNNGLNGEGTLNYLTSLSSSKNYSFYPDSLIARCDDFEVLESYEKPQFPSMISKIVDMDWLPDTNIMFVSMVSEPFLMFNNGSEFKGNIELSPLGAKGNGIFNFSNAQITSSKFDFYHHEINADTSDFELLTESGEEIAIQTHAYSSSIDFEKRRGWFKSNGRSSKLDLPFNQYICFMDEMEWDMDNNMMLLKNNTSEKIPGLEDMTENELIDLDLSGSEFVSVREDQDSLSFTALSGKYDMTEYIVYAEGVKLIKVADAAIFPGDEKIKILKNAAIETLYKASIIADTSTKYHRFYDADVSIDSKNKYHAKASYDYIDINKVHQKIEMNTVTVDTLGNTFAEGVIPEFSVFFLSPEYTFTGNVSLKSKNKFLTFDGGFSIDHDCYLAYNQRKIKFKTTVDPDNIYISLERNLSDIDDNYVSVGINYSEIDGEIYPAFLRRKKSANDFSIISAFGVINFDPVAEEYQIAGKDRLKRKSLLGNYLSLSKRNCLLKGEGKINLGLKSGYLQFETFGQINYLTIPDEAELKLVAFTDFVFDDRLLKMLSDSLNSSNLYGIDLTERNYKLALFDNLGTKITEELISDFSLYGAAKKIPAELLHTFVFTDINLSWDESNTSFISDGPIGIGNINKIQINKYVPGYFEIKKRRTGDEISFYLQLNRNEWYYFNYRNNIMQVISSNEVFNNRLIDLNPKTRIYQDEDNDDQYEYVISTIEKKSSFLKRMKKYFEKQ